MLEKIKILPGIIIEAEILDEGENKAAEYFNFDKYETTWHDPRKNEYHITPLLNCLRISVADFNEGSERSLETKGTFLMGHILHHEIGTTLVERDGFYILEFPFKISIGLDNGEEIYIVGKIDLLNNEKRSVGEIKSTIHIYLPKEAKDLKLEYYIQVIVYVFVLNHSYYIKEPIKDVYLVIVSKKNCYTKVIKINYTDEIGQKCYEWLINRAVVYHIHVSDETEADAETSKWCRYCRLVETPRCPEGREMALEFFPPTSYEATLFKKTYPKKKVFWKFDKENKVWIETKLFKAFKEELKQFEEKEE